MSSACPERIELDCGPVAAIDLALYAAASGDHNPLHLDAGVARAAGFERPVVHGMLTMAYIARLMTRHFGVSSLLSLSTRFAAPALLGDTVRLDRHARRAVGRRRALRDRGVQRARHDARHRRRARAACRLTQRHSK